MLPPDTDLALSALAGAVRGVGLALDADRCWLYARDPVTGDGVALVRWLRGPGIPDVPSELWRWRPEDDDLPQQDPLFARALAGEPADAVEDAGAAAVNPAIERALGHHAFVHLNLHGDDGSLHGVLQPGMTAGPRAWTPAERTALLGLRPMLTPLVVLLAQRRAPSRLVTG